MADQHILGLLRVDVHAARDNHVGLAVGEVEKAFIVDIADIAERRPALVVVGALRLVGIVVIGEDRCVGKIHGADFPGRPFAAVLVQNFQFADHGLADGAAMAEPLVRIRDGDAVAFGAGVIFDQDRSPPFDHLRLDLDRAGRGGVDRALQRGHVVFLADVVGQFQHPHEHGRHELRLRDLVFFHLPQEVLGVEVLHDDDGAAERDRHHAEA